MYSWKREYVKIVFVFLFFYEEEKNRKAEID